MTQASRDNGVDAVAVNPDPIVGGLCIVQAKRYTGVVSTESVRALGGVMDDNAPTKGVMVTTSWYGKESWEFAARHGLIELIDGPRLKHLLKERAGLDVLISLPQRAAKATQTPVRAVVLPLATLTRQGPRPPLARGLA